METRSKRWRSIKTLSVSSKSCTISSRASSWRRLATRRDASRGETLAKDFLFNIKDDLSGEEEIYSCARRHGLRPRLPPRQARADACTGVVDGGIKDTHLQYGLKDHPSASTQKGQVCYISSFVI